jgi:hypothetical protein
MFYKIHNKIETQNLLYLYLHQLVNIQCSAVYWLNYFNSKVATFHRCKIKGGRLKAANWLLFEYLCAQWKISEVS